MTVPCGANLQVQKRHKTPHNTLIQNYCQNTVQWNRIKLDTDYFIYWAHLDLLGGQEQMGLVKKLSMKNKVQSKTHEKIRALRQTLHPWVPPEWQNFAPRWPVMSLRRYKPLKNAVPNTVSFSCWNGNKLDVLINLCSEFTVSAEEENLSVLIGAAQGRTFTQKVEGKWWNLSPEDVQMG